VLHGIGWGAATTAATTLIADIAPPRRRGEAMAYRNGIQCRNGDWTGFSMILLQKYDFSILFS